MEKTYWTVTILDELRMIKTVEDFDTKEKAYGFSEKLKANKIANYVNKVTKVG